MLKNTSGWVSLCIIALFSMMALASTNPAITIGPDSNTQITPFTQSVKIGRNVHYLISDSHSPESILETPESQWEINRTDTVSLGFQTETYWFRTHIHTAENIDRYWILDLGNTLLDNVSVFIFNENTLSQQWHTGDNLPFEHRPIQSPRFLFPIELNPQQNYTLLLRIESTEAIELPLHLTERFAHAVQNDRRSLVDGIFHGFLIIMTAYSLAISITLRDKSYFFYATYVGSMLLFFVGQQGLLYQYFMPNWPALQHYLIPWFSMGIFISVAGFFENLLQLSKNTPLIWRFFRFSLAFHCVLCIGLLFFQYQAVVNIMATNVSLSMAIGVTALIKLSVAGSRSAQIILAGWSALFLFILLFVLARTGLFYNAFMAEYGLRIGVSLEILIFSYALSFRINQDRKAKEWALNKINEERTERIQAQDLALQREIEANQAKEQTLQMERRHRESLERIVEERTSDLERTLEDLEKANHELEQLSSRDALTGLFNRRVFDEKLLDLWEYHGKKNKPLSLLIVDADHFKQINDTYGHLCGDKVLQELAALFGRLLHRPTDIVARYGGEEFAVLLPDTPIEGAEHVADMIVRSAANNVFMWEEAQLRVTLSIGVHALTPKPGMERHALVEGADLALYSAKETGRNRHVKYTAQNKAAEANR